jgi:chitinase
VATLGVLVPALPALAADPEPPRALPQSATVGDLKWQPALDYDTNGCYNVPAIGPDGKIAEGLDNHNTTSSHLCRDQADLDNTNAYSRQRCNSGWCVYLYDYYFEKDVAVEHVADAGGHRHDWEHIAVWVQNDQAKYVAASAHGEYQIKPADEVRWDGTHPKIVYHKDGGSTHAFRFATANDEPPENHYGDWRRSTLVSYNGFPSGIRDKLFAHNFGGATIAIKDSEFAGNLDKAIPKDTTTICVPAPPAGSFCYEESTPRFPFNFERDEGSPGEPVETTAPTVPGNLRSTSVTAGSVALAWDASTDNVGVTGYEVYRGTSLVATVTGTTYTDTGRSANTAYTYTVRARDAAGNRSAASNAVTVTTGAAGGNRVLGYFAEWGIYGRNYQIKNIDTSGSASKLTHINYAFGNVTNGQCTVGDSWAAYERPFTAGESVDGVADSTAAGALHGNFNQLRKLKKKYPNLKVLWSFGGWTWSGGFGQAARNPAAFADSCYKLVEDPRWADVFDGIDIDWEYPNACGYDTCDTSGPAAFKNVMSAMRSRFGSGNLVTAAITADGTSGGKIDAADYAGATQYVDWYNVMTYDYFGAWEAQGPTAPNAPLYSYAGIPIPGFHGDNAIQKLKSKGVPAGKMLLGIPFYGRGWTGVSKAEPGGTATGAAPGMYEPGVEDYKVLKTRCPVTGTIAGTAYGHCGTQWWGYDTPATIAGKMRYSKDQGLAGAFLWELSGDTADGELITAVKKGLG